MTIKGPDGAAILYAQVVAKRHDPKNRLLELHYDPDGYWKVAKC
jgi:hypothetical protein